MRSTIHTRIVTDMKHCFIIFQILVSFLYILLISGCEKTALYGNESGTALEEEFILAAQKELSIVSLESKKGKTVLKFSDGSTIGFAEDDVPIVTRGIKGLWVINGKETELSEDEYSDEAIARSQFSKGDRFLQVVVEGYMDWSFYFDDNSCVVLLKYLFTYDPDSIIRGVNHRGFNVSAPENTLPAYRLSRLKGFKYVETDVRFTSDGIPVLLHDETVDRTSNGSGKVGDFSFEQIRSLDFGNWKSPEFKGTVIPTLDEFLGLCVSIGLEPNIELKEGTKEQIFEIVEMVENRGLKGKTTYISFSKSLLKCVLEKDPSARIGFLCNRVNNSVIETTISFRTGINDVYVGASDYSNAAIDLCMKANLPISIWVLNSENAILSLPSYVSGVTSDCLHAGRVLYEDGEKG